MIDLVGFNGIEPYIVLEWHDETGPRFKTVCYNEAEMNEMLERHNDSTDFYSNYIPKAIFSGIDILNEAS